MAKTNDHCPFCQHQADRKSVPIAHQAQRIFCQRCGVFVIWKHDELTYVKNMPDCERIRIGILLYERSLRELPTPVLQFSKSEYSVLPDSVPLHKDELLRNWPAGIPERIERAFGNLVRYHVRQQEGLPVAGRPVPWGKEYRRVLFTDDEQEMCYFRKSIVEYGWLERTPDNSHFAISPHGWAKFDEFEQGKSNIRNPAFVAMWFGGKDRSQEMSRLFADTLAPACEACGWKVKRADTDEHNEPIMDRIISDIRKAPFVVAELTDNNRGVYYEAGLAKGFGLEVIYCCPTEGEDPHFDVSGINQVRWENREQLREKLEDRIRATMGEGPYPAKAGIPD